MSADKITQRAKVLNYLRTHDGLTVRTAVTELNIMSLPKRVEELKKDGHDIRTDYQRTPNGSKFGVYRLVTE